MKDLKESTLIGSDPKVLFVGKENYYWYGESMWPKDVDSICYSPLQFAFYTIVAMGSYWAKIKDIMQGVFDDKEYSWHEQLQKVAFSNACKCFSENHTYLRNLHESCLKYGYLSHEDFNCWRKGQRALHEEPPGNEQVV